MGDREGESYSLNGLGEAALADGRAREALTHHEQARDIAIETGSREELARALTGLGRARAALGDTVAARATLERALALYVEQNSPRAQAVRSLLTTLPP
jgi:tetratricopeptide (TPR) repeat protein